MPTIDQSNTFGIHAIEYLVPPIRHSVRELHDKGLLISTPEAMEELGFEYGLMWDRPPRRRLPRWLTACLSKRI